MKHIKKLLALLLIALLVFGLSAPAMAAINMEDLVVRPFFEGFFLVAESMASIGDLMMIFAPITFLVGWFMGLFKLI